MINEKECKWFRVWPIRRFDEQGLIDRSYVMDYCRGNWEKCKRYQLEEKNIPHPDHMLPDGSLNESLKR